MFFMLVIGEVAEWLKAHAWKACIRAIVSRVRIPFSPPTAMTHNGHLIPLNVDKIDHNESIYAFFTAYRLFGC